MPCRGGQRIKDGKDKCKDYTLYTPVLTQNTDRVYPPSGVKINGKVITSIDENFAAALTDEQICKYLKGIDNIRANADLNWRSKRTDEAKNALEQAERFLCKYLKPATCEDKLDPANPSYDEDLKAEFDACAADNSKEWRSCKCRTISVDNDEVAPLPEEVYGWPRFKSK